MTKEPKCTCSSFIKHEVKIIIPLHYIDRKAATKATPSMTPRKK